MLAENRSTPRSDENFRSLRWVNWNRTMHRSLLSNMIQVGLIYLNGKLTGFVQYSARKRCRLNTLLNLGTGLCAKPIIDMLLVVTNSADEPSYVPVLESSGYTLRIREPEWFEHRLFKGPDTDINLHVFSSGTSEIDRMLRFRDWLRTNDADRDKICTKFKRKLGKE